MDYLFAFNEYKHQCFVEGVKQPQQRMLYNCLRNAILCGHLPSGSTLLASRALAQELKVARNTVLYVYEQLAIEGLVFVEGRNTKVAAKLAGVAAQLAGGDNGEVQLLSRRAQLHSLPTEVGHDMTAFMPGVPALAEFPLALWRRYMERAWRQVSSSQLDYGSVAGELALREAITNHLTSTRGVVCTSAQVFITDGTQHSLDLCAYALANAGDNAWIENPGYTGAYQAFKAAELCVRGIPVDSHGMAPSQEDWQHFRPALIYTTPSHQFPLGSVMSLERRLALIELARAQGAIIIEDDYDSEFRRDGSPLPAMQGLVENAPVVYMGTFSKSLFPALRIGYMVLPIQLVEPFTDMLRQRYPRGRSADQLALAAFLRDGQFAIHLRKMRRLYAARRDALVTAIEKYLGDVVTIYGGSSGIHLAIELPHSLLDSEVSDEALAVGIYAQPLSKLATGAVLHNGLMLGYAQINQADMEYYIERLARVIKQKEISF